MEDTTTQTKQCSRCNEVKPLTEFYPHPHTKAGVNSHCKKCHYQISKDLSSAWIKKRRSEDEEYRKEFNAYNLKRMNERYHTDHEYKERQRKYLLEYYQKNREAILQKRKEAKQKKSIEK